MPRVDIQTHDSDEGHAILRNMYADRRVRLGRVEDDFTLSTRGVLLGPIALMRVRHSAPAVIDIDGGMPANTVVQLHASRLQLLRGQHLHRVSKGECYLHPAGVECRATWPSYDASVVSLDEKLLAADAADLLDDRPLVFGFGSPKSSLAGMHWARTIAFVSATVDALDLSRSLSPLAIQHLAKLLNSAALVCFSSSADTARPVTDEDAPVLPAGIRRAKSYIEAHLDQPLTLADIASAARISARALQAGFRRHTGDSPMGYLRRVRLDAARQELLALSARSDPECESPRDPIRQIATCWGWTNAGRFASAYREAYGRNPSQDLWP